MKAKQPNSCHSQRPSKLLTVSGLLALTFALQVIMPEASQAALSCRGLFTAKDSELATLISKLSKLDPKSPQFTKTTEYQNVLKKARETLLFYGIETQVTTLREITESDRAVLKITKINESRSGSGNVNAKIISRIRERFQTDVYFDPAQHLMDLGRGAFVASKNVIFLDVINLDKQNFLTANNVLLHEIRHLNFRYLATKGKGHKFAGEFIAKDGKKLGPGKFYSEFMSLEEISNYYRDVKLAVSRASEMELSAVQKELAHAWSLGSLAIRNLRLATDAANVAHLEIFEGEGFKGHTIAYAIMDPQTPREQLATLFIDIHGNQSSSQSTRLSVREAAAERVKQLITEAENLRIFAESKFDEFQVTPDVIDHYLK